MFIGSGSFKNIIFILNLNFLNYEKGLFIAGFLSVLCVNSLAQDASGQKKDPVGKWKFEASTAPEGYTSGTMVFSVVEGKYTARNYFH